MSECDLSYFLATEQRSYAEIEKERASIVAKYRLVCTATSVAVTEQLFSSSKFCTGQTDTQTDVTGKV